ncbi:probable flavin-containing monooxygenase 1 [Juglans microcarpa x Juglans regia]|uniref:probable flavin-containing monooxygenase 1 n=1 Tax=Juglans microcarpa x Juglans regia TaxID=2249226 RepID=UPI001B7DF198|nr:probable flavin-containing monooxygenase 1 [Juglans microcarpa x Juglans regia]
MAPIVSKIGIIGAGVSGLAAAKQVSHHNPIVFEATDSIGGVWRHCSYNSTKLQSFRCDYEFSDFPWPDRDNTSFPSHTEILEYLHSYANHFDVLKFVRFNSKVVEIKFVNDGQEATDFSGKPGSLLPGHPVWEVAVQTNESESVQWYAFEFIVVCIGKYGDLPRIPEFPYNRGPEIFQGEVLHALDYCKLDKESASNLLKGKKVAVIGYKKSAIDLALECADANQGREGQPCTMVVRTLHWTVPHYRVWGLPFHMFYSTRTSQFLHERPNQSLLRTLLCLLLSPMRHGISKFIESYLLWKLPLQKYGLKPDHPFEEDYASCQMAIMPENFFSEADKGKIVFKRASKWWFSKEGIEFDDDTKVDADVVVLATGYDGKKKLKAILPDPFRSLLEYPSGVMPLYRGTIHPLIPNMAFVGYLESVSNLHSSELRSIWLARLLDDKFKLPSVEKMIEQATKEMEVSKKTTRFYKRHCISTFSINHSDEICEEMGWTSWRKKNWLSEAFSPYGSQDYDKEN